MSAFENVVTRRGFCVAGASVAAIGFTRLALADEPKGERVISQIAKFKLNMDHEAEALEALEEMCAAVEKDEPGVLAYLCHRSVKTPDEIVFFEVYRDDEAYKAAQ